MAVASDVLPTGVTGDTLILGPNGYQPSKAGLARPGFVSGRYYSTPKTSAFSTATLTLNVLYVNPFYNGMRQTFTGIGTRVTTAVGLNARFGVYSNSGGLPGSLVLDAGAMALTAGAQNDIAISLTLDPGWYWLGVVSDGGPVIAATSAANSLTGYLTGFSDSNTEAPRMSRAHTYGALPTSFGAVTYSENTSMTHIMLKV